MEEINFFHIANELFELEKNLNRIFSQGIKACLEDCKDENNLYKRRWLIRTINEMLDDSTIFSEAQFECFWQSGFIGKWNICKTKDEYISTVKKYVDLYGKPLAKDTIMYKAVNIDEDLFGGSWTKDWKSACNFAARCGRGKIVSMVVPKGTKTIHIHANFRFSESEDIINTTNTVNDTLGEFAELKELKVDKKGIVFGVFEIKDSGWIYSHKLNFKDSIFALSKQYESRQNEELENMRLVA